MQLTVHEIENELMPYELEGFKMAYSYMMTDETMVGKPPLLSLIYKLAIKHIKQEFAVMVQALDMLEDVGVKTDEELAKKINDGLLPGFAPSIKLLAHYLAVSNLCFIDDVGIVDEEIQAFGLSVVCVW